MSTYARLVAEHGLAHSHRLVLEAVSPGSRVLDVGCATGYLARELSARGCSVVGVEPDAAAARAARYACEQVVEGRIEDPDIRDALPGPFDAIVFADVLEHLPDPADSLRFARSLLAPDGGVVVSLPNIGHWTARRELVRGRFPRAEHGLFDRTHLHFFTRDTAGELAREAGYEVAEERFATSALPGERLYGRFADRVRAWTARRRPELFAFQFVLTLRPR